MASIGSTMWSSDSLARVVTNWSEIHEAFKRQIKKKNSKFQREKARKICMYVSYRNQIGDQESQEH